LQAPEGKYRLRVVAREQVEGKRASDTKELRIP
jgi:hypothetical protein